MIDDLKVNYLTFGDIYELQEKTGIQILFGDDIDEDNFSEAIRIVIRRN